MGELSSKGMASGNSGGGRWSCVELTESLLRSPSGIYPGGLWGEAWPSHENRQVMGSMAKVSGAVVKLYQWIRTRDGKTIHQTSLAVRFGRSADVLVTASAVLKAVKQRCCFISSGFLLRVKIPPRRAIYTVLRVIDSQRNLETSWTFVDVPSSRTSAGCGLTGTGDGIGRTPEMPAVPHVSEPRLSLRRLYAHLDRPGCGNCVLSGTSAAAVSC